MSNTNRDYLIVCEVKNSKITVARQLNFYITDKNTSNIFIKLVNKIENDEGISSYVDIENSTAYNVTLRIVKPNNETMSVAATQLEAEAIYQVDLGEDCKNIAGTYACELLIATTVNGREELNTSDPFTYLVKNSILSKVGEIIESGGITTEKILNDLDAIKAELGSQIKDIENKVVNVKDFGAKGDGITDDTEAINLAIQSTKKIIFPKGTYIVNSPLVLKDNTIIAGEGYTSILKCSNTFNGTELIKINGVKNTEIKDISLNGGSVFNWDTNDFSSLNGNIAGILIDNANSHVSVCRITNVDISLFSKSGIIVTPSTYEVIANTVVIKTCYLSGIYNRGTDSHWSNIYIGLCGNNSSSYLKEGAHLEGANNNYLNFKVYLCKYGGVYLESGTSYNNYSNFNIQECKGYGLNINTATNNNITNIVVDSCENGINMYKTAGISISGLISNGLSTVSTKCWLIAYSCEGKNYIDVLALVGTKSSDDVNITYLKSS